METEQLDVEEVADWTPKEKKEKRAELMVALGKTLVKHAPTKFGTQKSSDIIAEGIEEAGKITDKEALRKDERKYRAATKMYKDLAESEFERQTSYESALGKGLSHPQALQATTGITGTLTLSADPDQRKDQKKQIEERGVGTIFYDEIENSWFILTPDGSIKVTRDQIEKAVKSGQISEMRKPPEEEVIEEKVVKQTEPGTIKFDPNNVQIMRN